MTLEESRLSFQKHRTLEAKRTAILQTGEESKRYIIDGTLTASPSYQLCNTPEALPPADSPEIAPECSHWESPQLST